MGFFNRLKENFNEGRKRAKNNSYRRRKSLKNEEFPVKLVEPSMGNIVKLYIDKRNEELDLYMSVLEDWATELQKKSPKDIKYERNGQFFIMYLPEEEAERQRNIWR